MGVVKAVLERQTTITASTRQQIELPDAIHIDDIDIFMSSFAVTDAGTYTELDAMVGDIEIETSVGIESIMDATDYTTLLIYQLGSGQLIDATVADNDRQVFYWRHPFGANPPTEPELSMLALHGDHARNLYLNHAADGAVDNRVFSVYANGHQKADKAPKYYAMFVGRRAITGAVGGETLVDVPEHTRGGVMAKLARSILFGTTQIPDAENASHILNTIRRIDVELSKTKIQEIDIDIAQAIGNPATDIGVDSALIDNGSIIIDWIRGRIEERGLNDLPDVPEDLEFRMIEGAANAYRVTTQELLPTPR